MKKFKGYRFSVYSDVPKKNVFLLSLDLRDVKLDYLDSILQKKRFAWIAESADQPWSLVSLAADCESYRDGEYFGANGSWEQRMNGTASALYFLGEYGRRNAGDWKIKVERI